MRFPSAYGLEAVAAAMAFRETGDPFPGFAERRPDLRIGLCSSLSAGYLHDLIETVRHRPDAPSMAFVEGRPDAVVAGVRRGELDLALAPERRDWRGLEHEVLWRDPLMLAVPERHILAREPEIMPSALQGERILVAVGAHERDVSLDLIERLNPAWTACAAPIEVERETLLGLVGLEFGVALVTGACTGDVHPGVVCRPLAPPVRALDFHAVWRPRSHDPALSRFLNAARTLRLAREAEASNDDGR
ncbi:MAG TPA: LysR family substrate-binding domain-containing protein [Caulobacteraceae bacterium]|nr:LysR family substrate-binding domain-containing protein [Caulobacteraceae bacterium]